LLSFLYGTAKAEPLQKCGKAMALQENTAVGMALRNTAEAVPLQRGKSAGYRKAAGG
jgi:hypothetical protein